jgi:hypothetical protein
LSRGGAGNLLELKDDLVPFYNSKFTGVGVGKVGFSHDYTNPKSSGSSFNPGDRNIRQINQTYPEFTFEEGGVIRTKLSTYSRNQYLSQFKGFTDSLGSTLDFSNLNQNITNRTQTPLLHNPLNMRGFTSKL